MSAQPAAAPPGAPSPPAHSRRTVSLRRALLLSGAIVFIAGCAVTVLVLIGSGIGVQALAIGLVAAILPVPILVLAFLWLDRYEPEPTAYLIICFAWGAFVATLAALGVNTGASALFEVIGLPDELVAVAVAPFIEEIGKVVPAVALLVMARRSGQGLSGITDGIVYCGLAATGFAMVENIIYLGGLGWRAGLEEAGPATGLFNLLLVFAARILMSGFAHPLFTAAAGVGLGIAARTTSTAVRWLAPILGLAVAMLLHAAWNTMAVLTAVLVEPLLFLYGYVGVMMPIFFGMVGLAIWLRAREGQITQRTLPDYVRAGWLTPPEVAALRSLGTRHSARRWARRVAGEPGVRAMRRFQYAATRLALLRDGVRRGLQHRPAVQARIVAQEQELLAELSAQRAVYVGRDPAVPPAHWDGVAYTLTFPDGSVRRVPPPPEPAVPLPVRLPAVSGPPPAPAVWPGYPPQPPDQRWQPGGYR